MQACRPRRVAKRVLIVAGLIGGLVVATSGAATAMAGGEPVLDDHTAPWVATLAQRGDAPLLQRAGCGGVLAFLAFGADTVATLGDAEFLGCSRRAFGCSSSR